jgi:hypothetical protein
MFSPIPLQGNSLGRAPDRPGLKTMFRNGGAERPLIGRQAGDLPMADDRQIDE